MNLYDLIARILAQRAVQRAVTRLLILIALEKRQEQLRDEGCESGERRPRRGSGAARCSSTDWMYKD